MSIRIRILLSVAVGILVILVLLGFLGISATRESTDQTLAERLVLAQQVAHSVDADIEQALLQLETVSPIDLARINRGDSTAAAEYLRTVKRLLSFSVHYVCLVNKQRSVVSAEPPTLAITSTSMFQTSVDLVFSSNVAKVSNVTWDSTISSYVAYLTAPLSEPGNNATSLVVSAAIDLSSANFRRFTDVTGVGQTGYVEIVDGSGTVLATNNLQNFLKESDHGGVFAALIRERKTAVSTCHSCHTATESDTPREEIITFAPLSNAPWGVVVRQPEAEALANTRLLQRRLLISGSISLFIVLTSVWFATRTITSPINRLTTASMKIAQGRLDEPVSMRGKDEISILAQTFDVMRVKLKDSIEGIKQRTKELEGLNAIALTVSQSLDLGTILNGALQKVMELIKMEIGAILLLDEKLQTWSYRAHHGLSDQSLRNADGMKINESLESKVAQTGEPLVINDITTESPSALPVVNEADAHAFICFPLRSKDKVIGVMDLSSRKIRHFTDGDKQLLYSITSQISLAIENVKLYEEVRDKEMVLAELLKHSISAQEEERKRIARELHDETSQALATLAIGLETIAKSPPTEAKKLQTALKKIQDLTIKILDDVHRLILDLRPSALDDLGLIPALEWYAKNRLEPKGIKVHLETSGIEKRPPPHIEVALFRIAQEAISNIAQHARAEVASISLELDSTCAKMTVEDDGVGFAPNEALSSVDGKPGLGLLGMKERAELLGGSFRVQSEPGMGTQVSIEIPISWDENSGRADRKNKSSHS